jgi:hypothetical protein
MNCEQFREIVHDLARYEALGFKTLDEALGHAEQCKECDALFEEAESLSTSLHALAERYAAERAPARVEAALLAVLRQNRKPAPRAARTRHWALAVFAGAAAMLLAAVLVHEQKPVSLGNAAVSDQARVAVADRSSAPATISSEEDLALPSDSSQEIAEGWPVGYDGNAAADSFIPLSDAFDPTALDMYSVVRVAMSPPALERLAVYLDDLGSDGVVLADLAVSGDGTPQAIRIVQQ